MMGWNTSAEKEGGFQAIARALGVEINLSDSAAGLFKVRNTAARQRELAASISDMLEKGFDLCGKSSFRPNDLQAHAMHLPCMPRQGHSHNP